MKRLRAAAAALLLTALTAGYVIGAGLQVVTPTGGGTIANYGSASAAGPGQSLCIPDATSASAIATAYAGPNGGVSYTGFTGPDGSNNCTGGSVAALATPTPAATISVLAAGANAGSSPPAPSFVAGAGSNIQRGLVQFGTGASPAAGAMVSVTYPQTFASIPAVWVLPFNSATAALCPCYTTGDSTTGTTIVVANAPAASQAGTVFRMKYLVVP